MICEECGMLTKQGIKYCACDRGIQIEKQLEAARREAKIEEIHFWFGNPPTKDYFDIGEAKERIAALQSSKEQL